MVWESGGGAIFSTSDDVATRHVVLRDGSLTVVFVRIRDGEGRFGT